MPTSKPRKSVNIDWIDHQRAQAIADHYTKVNRELVKNDRLPETTIRNAISMAIEHLADELGIHIDEK